MMDSTNPQSQDQPGINIQTFCTTKDQKVTSNTNLKIPDIDDNKLNEQAIQYQKRQAKKRSMR